MKIKNPPQKEMGYPTQGSKRSQPFTLTTTIGVKELYQKNIYKISQVSTKT
ncbi:hypothetical protein [Helicobacter sp. 13S00482-2]|uniref:hypothetical protein n=1 Tax=Helicobacter sp. 13S00482-2 TaxID=1476200 RepID=UPI0015DB1A73|nr:hypothetical protein [Helicobacter sp. 13S00482-2]